MKAIVLGAIVALLAGPAFAQTYVQGYMKADGTYVQGYYRSAPDSSTANNYSTKGNVNPYTGQSGTQNATPSYGGYTAPRTTYGNTTGSNSSYGSTNSTSSSYGSSNNSTANTGATTKRTTSSWNGFTY